MSPYVGVSLFYADDGEEWAKYLRTKLGAKEYAIHSEMNRITDDPKCHTRSVNVNIFLLSPDFLDLDDWGIMKEFNPNTSIAILTGIDFRDLKHESRKKNCPEVLDWLVYGLTGSDDEQARNMSVRNMLVTIVAAYEGALQDERFGHAGSPASIRRTSSYPVPRTHESENQDVTSTLNYDYLPPLRQVNGLHDFIIHEDKMFVILHRQAEGSLRVHYNDNRSNVPNLSNPAYVYVFPISEKDQGQAFQIKLDGREIGKSDGKSEISAKKHSHKTKDSSSEKNDAINNTPTPCTQKVRKTTTLNDVGVQTESGPSESGQIDSKVTGQGQGHRHNGSKLKQIHDLLKDELDPTGLLCQCLGIERDLGLLDEKMTSLIESMDTLRHISYPMKYELKEEQVNTSWPTLLHFGAQYNLANFCDALLSNPTMHGACLTRNRDSFYPQDLARRNGHIELSEQLVLFSNYVSGGRDAKYDSGFSGCIPRLSTITLYRESHAEGSIPRPHTALMSPGYTTMRNTLGEEKTGGLSSYRDQTESNEEVRTPTGENPPFIKAPRTTSDDVGFTNEEDDEEDTENESLLDESRLSSSAQSTCSGEGADDIFGDILDYSAEDVRTLHHERDSERFSTTSKDSSFSVGSKSSFYLDEDVPALRQQKDIDRFLGKEQTQASTYEKRGGFFNFFGKKSKHSSKSSGSLSNSSKTKVYSRGSNRSSNSSSSSSGGSTTTLQDTKNTDNASVQYRDADDHKSKARFKLFMSKAQRRQSIRIKHVLEDTNMSGPTLPPRRKLDAETF